MRTARTWLGPLGWRLLAAFLVVAVGAVAIVALVAGVAVGTQTSALLQAQRQALAAQISTALSAAYSTGRGSWQPTTLAAAQALSDAHGTQIVVLDATGKAVATLSPKADSHEQHHGSPPPTPAPAPAPSGTATRPRASSTPRPHPAEPGHTTSVHLQDQQGHGGDGSRTPGPLPTGSVHDHAGGQLPMAAEADRVSLRPAGTPSPTPTTVDPPASQDTVPIIVDGVRVGAARLSLPTGDTTVAAARSEILRAVALGAALAAVLAALAAAVVSRRITRPLVEIAAATESFARGDPHPERLLRPAPGELGVLGRAFTSMAAALRHQEQLRRAVVADIAHELRTPVTILRGETEQLLDGTAEPTTARLVSLHDEVLRLQRVTDDLASLSAADAAGLTLTPEPVDLGALTADAVHSMGNVLDDAGLQFRAEAEDDVTVLGDPTRLTQVLTNLLTNAAKFTPAGGMVTVNLTTEAADAVLTVADTGPGIPPQELLHVFERFWRGRAAGNRAGTGIGLAVVDSLITAHGGTVTASSPPEGGAQFTIRLPLAPHSTH